MHRGSWAPNCPFWSEARKTIWTVNICSAFCGRGAACRGGTGAEDGKPVSIHHYPRGRGVNKFFVASPGFPVGVKPHPPGTEPGRFFPGCPQVPKKALNRKLWKGKAGEARETKKFLQDF